MGFNSGFKGLKRSTGIKHFGEVSKVISNACFKMLLSYDITHSIHWYTCTFNTNTPQFARRAYLGVPYDVNDKQIYSYIALTD